MISGWAKPSWMLTSGYQLYWFSFCCPHSYQYHAVSVIHIHICNLSSFQSPSAIVCIFESLRVFRRLKCYWGTCKPITCVISLFPHAIAMNYKARDFSDNFWLNLFSLASCILFFSFFASVLFSYFFFLILFSLVGACWLIKASVKSLEKPSLRLRLYKVSILGHQWSPIVTNGHQ